MDEKKVEEYGFVDILAVVLRYWKLIVIGAAISGILLTIPLLIKDKTIYTGTSNILISTFPQEVNQLLPDTSEKMFSYSVRSAKIFDAIKNDPEVNSSLKELINNNPGELYASYLDPNNKNRLLQLTSESTSTDSASYRLTIKSDDLNTAQTLLPKVLKGIISVTREKIFKNIDSAYKLYESMIEATKKSGQAINLDNAQQKVFLILQKIKTDESFPLITASPTKIDETSSRLLGMTTQKLLIFEGIAIVIFIIIAFLLDYIRRVRLDANKIQKLRDALARK